MHLSGVNNFFVQKVMNTVWFLQCDHQFSSNEVVYHVFSDKFGLSIKRLKINMLNFMRDNFREFTPIILPFIKAKGQLPYDYLKGLSQPNARADLLCIYMLSRMQDVHSCVITKDRVWFTFEGDGMWQQCDFVFVHTGGNTWKTAGPLVPRPPVSSSTFVLNKLKRKGPTDAGRVSATKQREAEPVVIVISSGEDEKPPFVQIPAAGVAFPKPEPLIDLDPESQEGLAGQGSGREGGTDDTEDYDPFTYPDVVAAPPNYPQFDQGQQDESEHTVPQKVFHFGSKRSERKAKYKCNYCRKSFKMVTLRNAHMANVHNQRYKCDPCKKEFASRDTFRRHMRSHDSTQHKFKCDRCAYTCLHKSRMDDHMKSHLKQKNYKCTWSGCDKAYDLKGDLDKHIALIHTKRLNFKCPECPKIFQGERNYNQHMRMHKDPEFVCQFCGSKFRWYQQLKNHWEEKKCFEIVE